MKKMSDVNPAEAKRLSVEADGEKGERTLGRGAAYPKLVAEILLHGPERDGR